jgi:Fe-S-cluster-containing hydrogenase component 2
VGLVEAMPQCGGYKVHADKLKRLGVPIYTSHSILSANGKETVESITIAEIDEKFNPIDCTEKTFLCDTILVAVGLDSLAEFTQEAKDAGLKVFAAGDALEIAEASSAMFNGKITGLLVAKELGAPVGDIPQDWYDKAEVLKSHPGKILDYQLPDLEESIYPLIHCIQEIPCNPCTTVCPTNSIFIKNDTLMGLPRYEGKCIGCGKCVLICPGLAITLIDFRKDKDFPTVTIPYELLNSNLEMGQKVPAVDIDGNYLNDVEVVGIDTRKSQKTTLVKVKAPKEWAKKIVSFQVQENWVSQPLEKAIIPNQNEGEAMICLCERVTVSDVEKLIEQGITDLNQIKAITRAGMGPCGAKTCEVLIKQLLRQKGIQPEEVVTNTKRPVFVEAFLETFADGGDKK